MANTNNTLQNTSQGLQRLNFATLLKTMRLPFLTLTLFCVFLGLSTAIYSDAVISWLNFSICLGGALAAHIAVNTLNEYQDFQSGLDFKTTKTPFSGGSGGLVENSMAAPLVLKTVYVSITVTVLCGGYFIYQLGTAILPLGLLGMVIIITYTRYINKSPLLCLLAPGVGFGALMVVGTDFVLSGQFSMAAMAAGAVCLFLVNNLLLLNQIPDVNADKSVGRKHLVIAYGIKKSLLVYTVFLTCSAAVVVLSGFYNVLPKLGYFALIPMLASVESVRELNNALKEDQTIPIPVMEKALGLNVIAANFTPLLLAICILIATFNQAN
ncbi:prenyltransferase [Thalassotalea psychrophila]|uniref:Prenyltransferase n=1 Tax=Thalassotalea psychrophila TaxID=3065647 RepID=A0ABY9TQB6_9GAMM|nr:prenyltransferase [Colwelliaceae bacterium SQ149]